MNVVIVEDDLIVADHLEKILNRNEVTVSAIIDSAEEALPKIIDNTNTDLVIVDIRLSGKKDGIELGAELNEKNIPFVYVTANNEISTLKKAAQTSPFSYITKPYKESDIIAFLEIFKSRNSPKIEVKTKYGKKQIRLSEVLYFEADGSYIKVITDDTIYTERGTLTELEKNYGNLFKRVHRSFLINDLKVEHYNSNEVYINGKVIPVSRAYKAS